MAELTIEDFILLELSRKNPSDTVIEYNNSFLKKLKECGQINRFKDITYENIIGLDTTLKKYISSEPTLYKRHSLFKRYIQEAINRGLFKGVNPYVYFNNSKGKSKDPLFLNDKEIELIKGCHSDYGYLECIRDLFLF